METPSNSQRASVSDWTNNSSEEDVENGYLLEKGRSTRHWQKIPKERRNTWIITSFNILLFGATVILLFGRRPESEAEAIKRTQAYCK